MTDIARILESTELRYARFYADAISDMLAAVARGNGPALADARQALAKVIGETMGIAEAVSASAVLQSAAGIIVASGENLRRHTADLVQFRDDAYIPGLSFDEAVADLVSRTPVFLRDAAERTAQRIAQIYSSDRVVAFARSAEQSVTERVQALIAQAIREGTGEFEAGRAIKAAVGSIRKQTKEWTESYARMAFRTNVNTAVTAGQFRQVRDPDIQRIIPAFRFDAVGDSDTRVNHAAADGRIWSVRNPVWNRLAPPLGYSCRCRVAFVSVVELRALGRLRPDGSMIEDSVPAGAFPDPGFRHRGRPDLFLSEGV